MKLLSRIIRPFRATESEYRANLAGLNTFFGAVLGFVITGVEQLDALAFAAILAVCSAIVMCILYVSASRNRWMWVGVAIVFIVALPGMMPDGVPLPPKLQPTLLIWLILTLMIELSPRHRSEHQTAEGADDQARPAALSGRSEPNTR